MCFLQGKKQQKAHGVYCPGRDTAVRRKEKPPLAAFAPAGAYNTLRVNMLAPQAEMPTKAKLSPAFLTNS